MSADEVRKQLRDLKAWDGLTLARLEDKGLVLEALAEPAVARAYTKLLEYVERLGPGRNADALRYAYGISHAGQTLTARRNAFIATQVSPPSPETVKIWERRAVDDLANLILRDVSHVPDLARKHLDVIIRVRKRKIFLHEERLYEEGTYSNPLRVVTTQESDFQYGYVVPVLVYHLAGSPVPSTLHLMLSVDEPVTVVRLGPQSLANLFRFMPFAWSITRGYLHHQRRDGVKYDEPVHIAEWTGYDVVADCYYGLFWMYGDSKEIDGQKLRSDSTESLDWRVELEYGQIRTSEVF